MGFLTVWFVVSLLISLFSIWFLVMYRAIENKWPEDKVIVIGTFVSLLWPFLIVFLVCFLVNKIYKAHKNLFKEYMVKFGIHND